MAKLKILAFKGYRRAGFRDTATIFFTEFYFLFPGVLVTSNPLPWICFEGPYHGDSPSAVAVRLLPSLVCLPGPMLPKYC